MSAVEAVPEVEAALNALIVALRAEGQAVGFIHRVDGSINLTVFDKEPGGTFYMGPVIAEVGGASTKERN